MARKCKGQVTKELLKTLLALEIQPNIGKPIFSEGAKLLRSSSICTLFSQGVAFSCDRLMSSEVSIACRAEQSRSIDREREKKKEKEKERNR